jgi:hypothetical protein
MTALVTVLIEVIVLVTVSNGSDFVDDCVDDYVG